ncbi:hypothetical protein RvY_04995 [Ramazzottius varieornatus]|uniref:Uncharacterized protein n=1 Tax=Ramazzottius varieornatus TaxID=947166 RepID=A0A1D1UZ89_RAMVA|nr:hypothetical protein RvY_04995 [Ramazzottius varieornatus]
MFRITAVMRSTLALEIQQSYFSSSRTAMKCVYTCYSLSLLSYFQAFLPDVLWEEYLSKPKYGKPGFVKWRKGLMGLSLFLQEQVCAALMKPKVPIVSHAMF